MLGIVITRFSGNPLLVGTYPGQNGAVTCKYTDNSSNIEYTNLVPLKFSVAISEITGAYVTGTFHGTLHNTTNPLDTISISGGRFKVPFVQ